MTFRAPEAALEAIAPDMQALAIERRVERFIEEQERKRKARQRQEEELLLLS